ncbi:response regulator [Paenibacillus methanolicus]|uniref:Two-component system response regulator YesN n=1 Tax=Paenibacillus methanolicus TaxID=582686 RepID=A0A5S5C8D0_9BACL|nr:response regulator [Paenibacillus methanolicus]TYP74590.1 two-component system response regulator YesN [Paenibacillus methanolicus]
MRQLLIVDDEPIAVEGLRSGVDWASVGIGRVMTAHSVDQAKEMFREQTVDILLCDIEMPKGTGLQLLEWVREHYPRTETIFLTCHAEFHYARAAIQLGSLDYLLKPIPYEELAAIVAKAVEKIEQERRQSEFSQFGKFWVQHQPVLTERFWLDILHQAIPAREEAIRRAADERNIPYSDQLVFLPILLRVRRWYRDYSLRDKKTMEYALRKAAEEMLAQRRERGFLISVEDDMSLVVLNGEKEAYDDERLRQLCEPYIEACRTYFHCDISCYIGERVRGHEMAAIYQRLRRLDADNVAYDNRIFRLGELQEAAAPRALPDMHPWGSMLKEGAREKVVAEAERFLDNQVQAGQLTQEVLSPFIQDFQQMVHYVLHLKGIMAHQLLSDRESTELFARASRSAKDAVLWIRHIVGKSLDYADTETLAPSVVARAKAYIQQHLAGEISREDIASHVYLNPDYLTRIFKRETGLSISDYLLRQRLGIAAELLASTDQPVSAVAVRIGYANFSHFSRMFKKYTGMNPMEYRQSRQHDGGGGT